MSWLWWVQIAADFMLIGAVLVLLRRLGGGSRAAGTASGADLEKFVVEAGRLTQEFDRLLGEKRELVNTTLASLDARIEQIRKTANSVGQVSAGASGALPKTYAHVQASADSNSGESMARFRKKVMKLAKQGKKPDQIAQATGRPRGEVELVLGLNGKG